VIGNDCIGSNPTTIWSLPLLQYGYLYISKYFDKKGPPHGLDHMVVGFTTTMVVGFTTTCAIGAYQHLKL
jgi:hypothetical protein